ncbi:MAG TPA: multiheme c-type cytochrome [Thermoguttaceae bacterium]|nr:multiheme c-type cytochrome [Thermoguttaceae bacterium]
MSVTPASVESRSRESDDAKLGDQGKEDEEPFDPVKENGPIFEGWPKPKWALLVSGRLDGYLEPCGCAGLDRMKGGLSRRYSMLEQLRGERGWPVAAVDVGGLVKGFGPQANLKFQTAVNSLQGMRYNAIAIGKRDLQLGVDGLVSGPFVSANVALFGFDFQPGLTPRQRVVEVGDVKLGITSILGTRWQREVNNSDVEMADPKDKLAEVVPALEKECDVLVLLAHATREESIELARQFPQFPVVITAGGPAEPPARAERIEGSRTLLIEVGEKGMNAVVLGFYDDPAQPIRYQRVPLDSRFPQADYVKSEMSLYQEGLKDAGLEGLGVTPVPYPGKELMGKFVGTAKCKSCHEESYRVWKKSGHAKAWQTLVELNPARNFDPECTSCHVVGWTPQNYRPLDSGFLSEKETPHLIDVGCETCHGPGEKHVAAELGSDLDLMEELRKPTVITLEESQQAVSSAISDRQHCMNCHDLDNSPDFDFETYWPKIEHREE